MSPQGHNCQIFLSLLSIWSPEGYKYRVHTHAHINAHVSCDIVIAKDAENKITQGFEPFGVFFFFQQLIYFSYSMIRMACQELKEHICSAFSFNTREKQDGFFSWLDAFAKIQLTVKRPLSECWYCSRSITSLLLRKRALACVVLMTANGV